MNQSATFLICAVLAAASSFATCQINNIYIDWTILEGWENKIESTGDAIISFDINLVGRLPAILRLIGGTSYLRNLEQRHQDLYDDLLSLADSEQPPTERLTNRVVEICAILNTLDSRLRDAFVKFLDTHVRKKFEQCILLAVAGLLNGSRENNLSEYELDQFFRLLNYSDNEMLNFLRTLDLGSSKTFEIKQSVDYARDRQNSARGNPVNFLYSFMNLHCGKLRKGREFNINVIALAVTFGINYDRLHTKIKKLLEYNRLCASLNRHDTNIKVRANLEDLAVRQYLTSATARPS